MKSLCFLNNPKIKQLKPRKKNLTKPSKVINQKLSCNKCLKMLGRCLQMVSQNIISHNSKQVTLSVSRHKQCLMVLKRSAKHQRKLKNRSQAVRMKRWMKRR